MCFNEAQTFMQFLVCLKKLDRQGQKVRNGTSVNGHKNPWLGKILKITNENYCHIQAIEFEHIKIRSEENCLASVATF